MLSLIVQIVSPTGCDVNSCPVFTWAATSCLVVLRWILYKPAAEVQLKQKLLKFSTDSFFKPCFIEASSLEVLGLRERRL
jgi:hypothetical protein